MRLTAFLVLVLLTSAIVATQVIGQAQLKSPHERQRLDSLIESLCSRHPAPSPKRMVPMREEKAVWKAVDELMSLGPKAFPALIDHFEDERYSYTEDNTTGERIAGPSVNRTVGYLCFHIVTAQVQKYVSWDEPDPRDSPGYYSTVVPWVRKDAVEWIKGRVDKPLWELQKENLSFVIEQNEKLLKDFDKDSREEKLCKEAIKKNTEQIAQLERTQKPLPSRNPRPRFER